jgi:hypothetical protein
VPDRDGRRRGQPGDVVAAPGERRHRVAQPPAVGDGAPLVAGELLAQRGQQRARVAPDPAPGARVARVDGDPQRRPSERRAISR